MARRINREAFLLLGGTAALLMQVAHPLVAAGVDRHSDFRRAPLRRLVRTVDTTLAVVFGDERTARRAMKRIDRRHGPVRGASSNGRAYDARDPALLLWVQSTLVLTSLRWYELVMGRLRAIDREAYWSEAKVFVTELGVPAGDLPQTIADLEDYEREMLRAEVVPDATAMAVGRDVLRPLRWIPEGLYWPTDVLAAGLLPPSLRAAFGLPYGARERRFFRGAIVALRALRLLLPGRLTIVPQARAFDRSVRGGEVR